MSYRSATDTADGLSFRAAATTPASPATTAASISCRSTGGNMLLWCAEDYGWTHGTAVNLFFAVLTVLLVPVAIMRFTRRLAAHNRLAAYASAIFARLQPFWHP